MVQKRRRVLWAKAHLKWTVLKWKSVLWSDESKFDILVGNHGHRVLRAKEEGACYQRSVQKPASLMVWGFTSAYNMGSLHVLEGTMNAERYIKVLEQHMLPSRQRLFQGRPCVFHAPRPNYFETCSRHQIWNELILCINCNISQFKHLCYLCSIVNKILAHVIWNSLFSFYSN